MKSQQQGSHSKRNGKICTHIATLQDHAIKALRSVEFSPELRYVRCKV